MLNENKIAVVVPCYNEQTQIEGVIDTMPEIVDKIIIVDDKSIDDTVRIVKNAQLKINRIHLIVHEVNQGVGGSIASGYKWARDNDYHIAVVMAGDGQMDPKDFHQVVEPVINGDSDYSKGNRLITGEAYKKIPKIRYFGNSILSLFTKIASGYWHIADSQTGYTAINKKALELMDWDKMYKRYGQPNDILVMLNVLNMRVKDVQITPVYGVGEKSGIKVRKVIFTISWLLLRRFLWRLKEKYIIRDFHPLVFFYFFGFVFGIASAVLFARLFYHWIFLDLNIPSINALAAMFSFMSSSQFILFAMWFDMEENKNLNPK